MRHLQKDLGSPSDKDLANAVDNNIFATSLTRRDIRIARNILGPNVVALKGKTTKRKSKMPNSEDIEDLSSYIIEEYSDVSLYIDVMHVNGIMFLVSASKYIGLIQSVCI